MVARVLSPKVETVTKVKATVNNKDREEEAWLHWQRHWLSCMICFHMKELTAVNSCLNDNNL